MEVIDFHKEKEADIMGSCTTSLGTLLSCKELRVMCIKEKSKLISVVYLEECVVKKRRSFLEYIKSGVELNMIVAIDYTGSNGEPSKPESLHYIHPDQTSKN